MCMRVCEGEGVGVLVEGQGEDWCSSWLPELERLSHSVEAVKEEAAIINSAIDHPSEVDEFDLGMNTKNMQKQQEIKK